MRSLSLKQRAQEVAWLTEQLTDYINDLQQADQPFISLFLAGCLLEGIERRMITMSQHWTCSSDTQFHHDEMPPSKEAS